jgi:hypothetical protein
MRSGLLNAAHVHSKLSFWVNDIIKTHIMMFLCSSMICTTLLLVTSRVQSTEIPNIAPKLETWKVSGSELDEHNTHNMRRAMYGSMYKYQRLSRVSSWLSTFTLFFFVFLLNHNTFYTPQYGNF